MVVQQGQEFFEGRSVAFHPRVKSFLRGGVLLSSLLSTKKNHPRVKRGDPDENGRHGDTPPQRKGDESAHFFFFLGGVGIKHTQE